MSSKHGYSSSFRPPAPVLAVRVSAPGREPAVGMLALIDSGADLSVVPRSIREALELPEVSTTRIQGVTGVSESTSVHAAAFDIAGSTELVEVVAWGDEAILGRDLLNRFVLELDGPRETLTIAVPARPPRRRLKRVR